MPLPANTRFEAEALVMAALESAEGQNRRIAAEAQLNYRLRESFQRIDDAREIDLEYLTCAEYQLFIDDMRALNQFFQPDQWTDYRFPKGKALEPVLGVRPSDAEVFCRWLTQRRQEHRERYRLPTSEEARQYSPRKQEIGCWCRDVGEFKLCDLTTEEEQKIQHDLDQAVGLEGTPPHILLNLEPDLRPDSNFGTASFRTASVYLFAFALIIIGAIGSIEFLSPEIFGLVLGVAVAIHYAREENQDFTFTGALSSGAIISFATWAFLSIKGDTNIAGLFAFFAGMGAFLGCLLNKSYRDFEASRSEPGYSEDNMATNGIVDLLTQPLAKKVCADLLSRELKQPTLKTDNELALHILKRDLDMHRQGLWKKSESRTRAAVFRNTSDTLKIKIQKEYWFLKMIIARKEGALLACESIRLVRERL